VKYDMERRIAHEDGWIILSVHGKPRPEHTLHSSRRVARQHKYPNETVVACRRIYAWKKP